MRLIASGDRPSCFAASSNEAEDLANSISRRSSLNDQGLRAITETILLHTSTTTKPPSDPCSLDGFAWVGPGLGEARCENEYVIGENAQHTTRIKLTAQPYRVEAESACFYGEFRSGCAVWCQAQAVRMTVARSE